MPVYCTRIAPWSDHWRLRDRRRTCKVCFCRDAGPKLSWRGLRTMKILAVSWGREVPTPALRMAATLSKEIRAELHIAHLWAPPLVCAPVFIEPTYYERQEEDARPFMEAAVETVEAAGGIVAKTHVRMGWPVGEVPRL